MVPVELGLGNGNGLIEVVIGQGRIQDRVAVLTEIGRLDAAFCRTKAVEVEDEHHQVLGSDIREVDLPDLSTCRA